MSRRSLLLIPLLVAFLLAGVALWRSMSGEAVPASAAIERDPTQVALGERQAATGGERDAAEQPPPPARPLPSMRPLEVKLELVRASGALSIAGELPLGGGARARLRGSLNGAGGAPVTGSVHFLAGTNTGRVLETDGEGRFGANDLHPGLQIVEVRAQGGFGALREIRLRNNSEEQLNLGFGMPATILGRVIDTRGEPVEGAEVILDGQQALSAADGAFHFSRVAPGHRALVLVRKPGFARFRQILAITAGSHMTVDGLDLVLEPGCELSVTIQQRVGADAQAQLFLLPAVDALTERKFPWHEVNPTPLHAGGTAVIEDLPAGTVQLVLFHQGARSKARVSSVTLSPDRRESIVLHLEAAPRVTGRVLRDGKPVAGALVSLQAPDPSLSTVRALDQPLAYLETAVLPLMPPGVQRAYSSPLGEFVLSGYWEWAPARYLTVEGPGGGWAGAVVRDGDAPLELELGAPPERSAVLTLDLIGEHGGLPVDLSVDGVPRERFVLPPGEPLDVGGLVPGQWKLSLRWDSAWMTRDQQVTLGERTSLLFRLPEGALAGS